MSEIRLKRPVVLIGLAFFLVMAACGDDQVGDTAGVAASELIDPVDVVDAIVAELGDEDGFAAVVLAFDAGYSIRQVVEAGLTGRLERAGTIEGEGPEGEPYGLIGVRNAVGALFQTGSVVLAVAIGPSIRLVQTDKTLTTDEFLELIGNQPGVISSREIQTQGNIFITTVLHLIAVGYGLDQVVDGLIFGELTAAEAVVQEYANLFDDVGWTRTENCVVLRAADGTVVTPKFGPFRLFRNIVPCADALDGTKGSLVFVDGQTNGGQGDPVPPTDGLTPDSGYLIEASLIVEPGAAEFAWTGDFAIGDEGDVVGNGQGSGFSKGSCSVDGGDPAPYSFSATWAVDISGTIDESGIDIVLTPRNPSITQGPGTDESIFCVGIAKSIFVDAINVTLGGEGPLGVVKVPDEGGTTTVGTEPFLVEVIVTAPQA